MSAEPVFHLPTPDHGATWEGVDWEALVDAAVRCRERAYAPYSDFRVGAALLAANGNIYVGCNVENRVLGLTLCAERGALSAAVADGQASFVALAIATGSAPPCAPCGQCRDALAEFCRDPADRVGHRRDPRPGELEPVHAARAAAGSLRARPARRLILLQAAMSADTGAPVSVQVPPASAARASSTVS